MKLTNDTKGHTCHAVLSVGKSFRLTSSTLSITECPSVKARVKKNIDVPNVANIVYVNNTFLQTERKSVPGAIRGRMYS